MVPIRIALEGFMSYREKGVFDFEGAPLWMLCGPNGSGKSTVFDAITYALYGAHRNGKQNARDLINHASDQLLVEFDFALGPQLFRIKRTLSRRNRSGVQAFRIENGEAHAIAETDMAEGFKKWIDEAIGLDEKTFTSSVLLQQNKSDALLNAEAGERHRILTQIVDLSAYQKLHDKVNEQRRYLSSTQEVLDNQLSGLERIDPSEIERLDAEARGLRERAAECVSRLEELSALAVHAARFQEARQECARLEGKLSHARALLERAGEIEERHARWAELQSALPSLRRLLSAREEAARAQEAIARAQRESASWAAKIQKAQGELEAAQTEAARLKASVDEWTRKREDARERLQVLAPALRDIEALEAALSQMQVLDRKLEAFPGDLDEQLRQAREDDVELSCIEQALPSLRRFVDSRERWDDLKERAAQARALFEAQSAALSHARGQVEPAQAKKKQAEQAHLSARNEESAVRAEMKQAREHLAKLADEGEAQVLEGASCDFCGAPLSPEHLAQEKERRQKRIDELHSALKAATRAVEVAREELDEASKYLHEREQEEKRLDREVAGSEAEVRALKNEGTGILKDVSRDLAELPEEFRRHFDAQVSRPAEHFKNPFPTASQMQEWEDRRRGRAKLSRRLQELQEQERERALLLSRREPLQEAAAPLLELYDSQERARVRLEGEGALATEQLAKAQAQESARELQEREATRDALQSQKQSACSAHSALQAELAQAEARLESQSALAEEMRERFPADWAAIAAHATREDLARFERESQALHGAGDELRLLNAARAEGGSDVEKWKGLQEQIETTPPEHQRAVAEIEAERAQVLGRKEGLEQNANDLDAEKQALQGRREQRRAVEEELKEVSRLFNTHKTLAELLGQNRLQRHLLRRAEESIVEGANRILDAMSGGTLQLELRADEEAATTRNGAVKSAASGPKALELMATNSSTNSRPMPVWLLSGSQRFRVAVALALGIGQFAGGGGEESNGGRRIESVIIDEGFGSLDQDGRENIIEELRALKGVLQRVIIVSHQEELARAFPSRYEISLEDGTSKARIVAAEF
jgi:exonuclease SbcC